MMRKRGRCPAGWLLGYEVVETAYDGQDALELGRAIKKRRPRRNRPPNSAQRR